MGAAPWEQRCCAPGDPSPLSAVERRERWERDPTLVATLAAAASGLPCGRSLRRGRRAGDKLGARPGAPLARRPSGCRCEGPCARVAGSGGACAAQRRRQVALPSRAPHKGRRANGVLFARGVNANASALSTLRRCNLPVVLRQRSEDSGYDDRRFRVGRDELGQLLRRYSNMMPRSGAGNLERRPL